VNPVDNMFCCPDDYHHPPPPPTILPTAAAAAGGGALNTTLGCLVNCNKIANISSHYAAEVCRTATDPLWTQIRRRFKYTGVAKRTRSSATAKSTARPWCLVGLLYDIYRETNNRSTANQPLIRNWP